VEGPEWRAHNGRLIVIIIVIHKESTGGSLEGYQEWNIPFSPLSFFFYTIFHIPSILSFHFFIFQGVLGSWSCPQNSNAWCLETW
jgi:hypothetical protein